MIERKHIVCILTVIFCMVLVSEGKVQELRQSGSDWVAEIQKNFKVNPGGTLVMEDIRGDIVIQTWERNEVEIHETKRMDIFSRSEAEAAIEETEKGYIQQGNTISVGGPAFNRRWIESRFQIWVPVEFNCEVETEGGDLSVTGIKGTVEASTGGGEINLSGIDGPVRSKTGGGRIKIENTTQDVTAETGGGEIDISNSEGPVNASSGGGDITIDNTADLVRARTGGGSIDIVRTQGSVDVETGGGNVDIIETQGSVDVETGGGDITIRGAGGGARVQTGGGDVDIQTVRGNFIASTGGGDIDVNGVVGTLDVRTGGGEVDLADIQGAVEATTGGGDVRVKVTLTDFSVDHHIGIQTGGGNIDLTIPEKLPVTINATIRYQERRWEDYTITSDFPLKITSNGQDSRYRIIQATGDINGGGDPVQLNTGGGNIHIRKLK
ncbi:DUF4097 family beta strand repeat protein [bacterium]|nr:DUF4097 family beta strand repeat protein [bacterium]